MNNLTKDVYLYLLNFADDKTVLNMLSVNKKFNDEKFFKQIMERRYPLLLRFKEDNKTWKQFYIETIYYISKLKEEFDIPYIPVSTFDPKDFYKRRRNLGNADFQTIYDYALEHAADSGDLNLVKFLVEEHGAEDRVGDALYNAVDIKNLEIVKYIVEKFGSINKESIKLASRRGYEEILKYLIAKLK